MSDPADAKTFAQPKVIAAGMDWSTLQQMPPVPTGHDVVDEASRDPMLNSEVAPSGAGSDSGANLTNLIVGQFSAGMSLSSGCAALMRLVGVVRSDSAIPKVRWLVAKRIVTTRAVVADDMPCGDRSTVLQFPGDAMGTPVTAIEVDPPVPLRSRAAGPDQTGALTNAFGPELIYGKLRTHRANSSVLRPRMCEHRGGIRVGEIIPCLIWSASLTVPLMLLGYRACWCSLLAVLRAD